MDINKYYVQLLNDNPELTEDENFAERLQKQLLSELQVVLVRLKPEEMADLSEDNVPLSIVAKKYKRGRPFKGTTSSLSSSKGSPIKENEKCVVELKPKTNCSPTTVKISVPTEWRETIRFEIDLPAHNLNIVQAATTPKYILKKQAQTERKKTKVVEPTDAELSNLVALTLEDNVSPEPVPAFAQKRRRPSKKINSSKKKKDEEEEKCVKGDLARYVEEFSGENQSCSSTPKVTSTTQNENSNVYDYEFNLIDYINNTENPVYNDDGCFTQNAEEGSGVIYLPQVSLEPNMQYSIHELNNEEPIIVSLPQSWNENNNNNNTNNAVVEENINEADDAKTNANMNEEVKEHNLRETESFKAALDMPSLDDMEPLELSNEEKEFNIGMQPANKDPELFEDMCVCVESQLLEPNCINSDTIDLEKSTDDISNITMDVPIPMVIKMEDILEYLGDTGENDDITQHDEQPHVDENLTEKNTIIKEDDLDAIDIEVSVLDMEQLWQNEIDFEDSESILSGHGSSLQKTEESSSIIENSDDKNLEENSVFYAGTFFAKSESHNLRNSLQRMEPFELNAVYNYHCNHKHLFIKYFPLFCEVYGLQKKRNKLFNMVRNCERYIDCGHLLQSIYSALMQCGFNSVNACRHILKRSIDRTPQTIDALVNIIFQAGWTMFHEDLISFGQKSDYKYSYDTIEKMVPMVIITQNKALHTTFIECLFHMRVEEALKISDEVKNLLLILKSSSVNKTY